MLTFVFRHKKEQPLGHRPRTHVSLKHLPRVVDHKIPASSSASRFMHSSGSSSSSNPGRPRSTFPSANPFHVSRESKLPCEHHRPMRPVIEQNRRPIAPSYVSRFCVCQVPSRRKKIKRSFSSRHTNHPTKVFTARTRNPPRFRHLLHLLSRVLGLQPQRAGQSPCSGRSAALP